MTSLLLWKEHLKRFYNRYSYGIQPVVRFLFALCTMVSLNTNIGYMAKLKSPLVILPVCLVSAFLPYGAIVFLAGCLMIAHVYAVSLEMALIAIVLILTIAILYYGFKPGDSYLMVLTPLAFLFKIPYVVPLLVGLGGSLASVIPVGCGVFLYYLLIYVKQNAGILAASDGSVDIVQKYSQILKSVLFNQTMIGHDCHLRGGHHRGVSHTQAVHGLRMGGCHCGRSRGGASGYICGGFCVWGICFRGTDDSGTCFIGSHSGCVQFFCPVCGLYPDRICAVRGR